MKLSVDNISINWNYGLSIQPVSVFLNLKNDFDTVSYELEEVFKTVTATEVKDVMFYGDFSEVENLNWLTVKLLAEGYFVSAIMNIKDKALPIIRASRVIVYLELDDIKNSDLSGLTESDYIIINESKVNRILATAVRLSGLGTRIGRLYFNTLLLSREDALKSEKLFNIYPYDGDNIEVD